MPDITKGKTFVSGETVTATELNNLIDNATINSLVVDNAKLASNAVDNAKVSSTAAIAYSKLATLTGGNVVVGNSDNQAASVTMSGDATMSNTGALTLAANAVMPTGAITQYAGTSAPTGWLFCDGEAIDSGYTDLIAIVGANTPNLQGNVPVGKAVSGTFNVAVGTTGGVEDVTLTGAQSGTSAHTHGLSSLDFQQSGGYTTAGGGDYFIGEFDVSTTAEADALSAHTNLQPYIVVNYIIKT